MSYRMPALALCVVSAVTIAVVPVCAQPVRPALCDRAVVEEPLRDGDSSIAATLPDGAATNLVAVRIDGSDATIARIVPKVVGRRLRVRLSEALRAGQTIDVQYFSGSEWSPWSREATVHPRHPANFVYAYDANNDPFIAEAFLAANLDNFSAFDPEGPPAEGSRSLTVTNRLRMTAGFSLEYRLIGGHSHSERQLWIYSRLAYAPRSGEELCTTSEDRSQVSCLIGAEATGRANEFTRIIEHARTFESVSGVRLDLFTVQPASTTATKFFVMAEGGPLLIAGTQRPRNVWTFGGGLRIPEGRFHDTKIEVGLGSTDYFIKHAPRFKVHGFLAFPLAGALRLFGEVRTDANFDAVVGGEDGSLSLITVMGLHLEVAELLKR